jgi:hypothetical protein
MNSRRLFQTLAAVSILAALLTADAHAQSVITDNDPDRITNTATWMELSGGVLTSHATLATKGWGLGFSAFGTNAQAVAKVGSNMCIFISDPGSDDITAFNATTYVGQYTDSSGSGAWSGIALAVHGTTLYAGYSASVNIGIWTINADCSLTLARNASATPTWAPVDDIAIAPNGATLIATYGYQNVDSFAISGATLTEKGPFTAIGYTAGIDITKDSKYAIVGDFSANQTEVEILPINANSTLGATDNYVIAQGGLDSNNVWLSPDQTLLYVSNNVSIQVTTLNFKESAAAGKRLTFDCLISLNTTGRTITYSGGLATQAASGVGGYLYVTEAGNPSGMALLKLTKGQCPVEVSVSPFDNAAGVVPVTVTVYPPRPF